MKLRKRAVESLKAEAKEYFVWDEELPGFGLRVMPTGRKTFHMQYRAGGRTRRVKIGVFGMVTADEARTEARKLGGAVAKGEDPAAKIKWHRSAPTVATVCDRFLETHVAHRCKPKTAYEYTKLINRYVKPRFGTRKLVDITRADIAEMHHDMRDRPFQANRVLALLSKMFNCAEIWQLRRDGSNPCRLIQKNPETKRERYLSREETARLFSVLDKAEAEGTETKSAINAFRLLMLTGCRLGEIQMLKWEYIDGAYLRLPDSKTGARKIPITDEVRAVLERIEPMEDNPYVIYGKVEGQHLTDLQHPWRRIRAAAELDDVRIHDLRHTYASHAISNGLSLELIGKLLGHTQFQTTMRYAHLADDPVREAASQVSAGFKELINNDPARSVPPEDGKIVVFPAVEDIANRNRGL